MPPLGLVCADIKDPHYCTCRDSMVFFPSPRFHYRLGWAGAKSRGPDWVMQATRAPPHSTFHMHPFEEGHCFSEVRLVIFLAGLR